MRVNLETFDDTANSRHFTTRSPRTVGTVMVYDDGGEFSKTYVGISRPYVAEVSVGGAIDLADQVAVREAIRSGFVRLPGLLGHSIHHMTA